MPPTPLYKFLSLHQLYRFAVAYVSRQRKSAENALALATHRKLSSDADEKRASHRIDLFARPPFKSGTATSTAGFFHCGPVGVNAACYPPTASSRDLSHQIASKKDRAVPTKASCANCLAGTLFVAQLPRVRRTRHAAPTVANDLGWPPYNLVGE